MSSNPTQTAVNPTWTWGSSALLSLGNAVGADNSTQLAQVTLPEPAVCSLYMQAVATSSSPDISVGAFTLNLSQGLGRVTIPRQVTFAGQPSVGGPLEWTLPFIPLHALQVDVECTGDFRNDTPGQLDIQIYFVIAPITRIPQKIQKLQFGMALPGEADALDDELLENLEGDAPTVSEIMGNEAEHRIHGEGDDDDDGGDDPQAAPAWMLDLVDALTQRLHRAPTRAELRKAVDRMRERQARRAR